MPGRMVEPTPRQKFLHYAGFWIIGAVVTALMLLILHLLTRLGMMG